jgi:hypothetical protein
MVVGMQATCTRYTAAAAAAAAGTHKVTATAAHKQTDFGVWQRLLKVRLPVRGLKWGPVTQVTCKSAAAAAAAAAAVAVAEDRQPELTIQKAVGSVGAAPAVTMQAAGSHRITCAHHIYASTVSDVVPGRWLFS